jgi:hypothetical protein
LPRREKGVEEKRELSVDAATLAMRPIALNGVERLIGDVEQAAQVIALARVLFGRDDFWVTAARIHQP